MGSGRSHCRRGMIKAKAAHDESAKTSPRQRSCANVTATTLASSTLLSSATRPSLKNRPGARALGLLRELAKAQRLTLLTATKAADISEAHVLGDRIGRCQLTFGAPREGVPKETDQCLSTGQPLT